MSHKVNFGMHLNFKHYQCLLSSTPDLSWYHLVGAHYVESYRWRNGITRIPLISIFGIDQPSTVNQRSQEYRLS